MKLPTIFETEKTFYKPSPGSKLLYSKPRSASNKNQALTSCFGYQKFFSSKELFEKKSEGILSPSSTRTFALSCSRDKRRRTKAEKMKKRTIKRDSHNFCCVPWFAVPKAQTNKIIKYLDILMNGGGWVGTARQVYGGSALKGFHSWDLLRQSPRGIKEQSHCQIIFDKHAFKFKSSGFVSVSESSKRETQRKQLMVSENDGKMDLNEICWSELTSSPSGFSRVFAMLLILRCCMDSFIYSSSFALQRYSSIFPFHIKYYWIKASDVTKLWKNYVVKICAWELLVSFIKILLF